jgi:FkbM family methyltransferase
MHRAGLDVVHAIADDEVGAVLETCHESREVGHVIREVSIRHDDVASTGGPKAREVCAAVAATWLADDASSGRGGQGATVVGRAVVDDHDLATELLLGERAPRGIHAPLDAVRLVQTGDHHRDQRLGGLGGGFPSGDWAFDRAHFGSTGGSGESTRKRAHDSKVAEKESLAGLAARLGCLAMLGGRSLSLIMREALQRSNYLALWRMPQVYPSFLGKMRRYFLGGGSYPYRCELRTPMGRVAPTIYSHHDLWTVNEIFCRRDYPAERDLEVVVDVGSNIGISALWFLTRNERARCYCYEPLPRNIERLRENLRGLEARYRLHQTAVADAAGRAAFGIEPTGRYGGIGRDLQDSIEVECVAIADVIAEVLSRERRINVLKIDTEGLELQTVCAIPTDQLEKIDAIYFETEHPAPMFSELFDHEFGNQTVRLRRRRGESRPQRSLRTTLGLGSGSR